ncbi:poly(3-hydroxybutyrate) depolymerase [Rugamonas sp.]|uniref:extracellular catalytic domain type 2 short-chain-length polyhydroxyalkanoate depolymerase n=1 Tax=Rugamonas sp. TaxID=1926287 RepID=UPI0025E91661|nr:poly(3-hydroxybutyrate) depolymerase [Rugamonas sp.]
MPRHSFSPYARLLPALLGLFIAATAAAAQAPELGGYQADPGQTTVSGLSSGGYMAGQFAVAYSATIKGVALIGTGPYGCSTEPGVPPYIPYLVNAMTVCGNPASAGVDPPDAAALWRWAQLVAQRGVIDDTAHLQNQKVYIFSGRNDQTVTRAVVDQTARFYQLAGVPAANLRYLSNVDAGHAIITSQSGDVACGQTASPFINNCGFVQSQDMLNFLYAGLNPPAATLSGKIVAFNQRSFIKGPYSSMNQTAYAYVPAACNTQSCRIHVAFHGCLQDVSAIGNRFYAHTGYNELADSNRIIMLYPQAAVSRVYPYNPNGCWDFWGYSDVDPFLPDFYARSGIQMTAVKAMIDRLAAPRGSH